MLAAGNNLELLSSENFVFMDQKKSHYLIKINKDFENMT